jgi:hypothetical protein
MILDLGAKKHQKRLNLSLYHQISSSAFGAAAFLEFQFQRIYGFDFFSLSKSRI